MPTYEYTCKTCGNRFEAWQKMTDEPLTECPKCHSEIHRVLFPAGVVFKGSGFYSTDSRTDSRGHKSGGETATASTSETSGESKTEAKTETKTEAVPAAKSESSTAQSSTDSAKAG